MADEMELKKKTIFLGNHDSTLLVELNKERTEEDSYCDVTLCVDEQQFHGHRCILGKFSKMLHKMFKTEMKEKYDNDVNLKGLNAATMQLVMGYIYTARVEITKENAVTLLSASDYLQIDALKQHCSDFFVQNISPLNVLGVQKAAKMYNETSLATSSATFLSLNKESIFQQPEFNDLDAEEVANLLFSEEERPEREEMTYKSLVRWVKHDVEDRENIFPLLLANIKLHLLPTNFLDEIVFKESLISGSDLCKDYLASELLKRLKISSGIKNFDNEKSLKFVFVNGQTIQLLDVRRMEITRLPDVPYHDYSLCAVACHNKLFLVRSNGISFLRFDLKDDTWRSVERTGVGRISRSHMTNPKALFYKGRVVVLACNGPVEWFDPEAANLVCSSSTPMPAVQSDHSLLQHRGYLVSAGPNNTFQFTLNDSREWSAGVGLDSGTKITAAVSCGDFYVFDNSGWLNRLHPLNGQWKKFIFVDAHVVSALADGETIHAIILSWFSFDLWSYNTKTGEINRQHVAEVGELGKCLSGIIY